MRLNRVCEMSAAAGGSDDLSPHLPRLGRHCAQDSPPVFHFKSSHLFTVENGQQEIDARRAPLDQFDLFPSRLIRVNDLTERRSHFHGRHRGRSFCALPGAGLDMCFT